MFLVTIKNHHKGEVEEHVASHVEIGPSTSFLHLEGSDVLLYGHPIVVANFSDRPDAALQITTYEKVKIEPFFEPVERPDGY
jgi:hypothetical protein